MRGVLTGLSSHDENVLLDGGISRLRYMDNRGEEMMMMMMKCVVAAEWHDESVWVTSESGHTTKMAG